jgi:transposase
MVPRDLGAAKPMSEKDVTRSLSITAGQLRESPQETNPNGCPKGESTDLAKEGGSSANPYTASVPSEVSGGGETSSDSRERIVVIQASIVEATPSERMQLSALRNVMHRALNAALSEWHRAEKRPSTRNPDKEVLDRGAPLDAIKTVFANEKAYWRDEIPKLEAAVEVLRPKLGRAKAKNDSKLETELQSQLDATHRSIERAQVRAGLEVPSAIYDSIVVFTKKKYDEYKKEAFRGSRSNPTFRENQPIRWRDGCWKVERTEKKGVYKLRIPLQSLEKRKIEYATVTIIPDGPSMYNWLRRLTDEDELSAGTVSPCDMRAVYSEKKKQWFVKLTARFQYTPPKGQSGTAAIRRGVKNAFVLVFEDGDPKYIEGTDVLHFKAKIKGRLNAVRRHLKSLEIGSGACGHGKKRRQAAITRIADAEARFIDSRIKTWSARIVRILKTRGVGTLLMAESNVKEFIDSVDNSTVQALLRQWPFAKTADALKRACEVAGIKVTSTSVNFNVRRCPNCKHVHEAKQVDVFTCEVCGLMRPSDQILAWNSLIDVTGTGPIVKAEAKRRAIRAAVAGKARSGEAVQ